MGFSAEDRNIYFSTLNYMLKEAYYNAFIQDGQIYTYVKEAFKNYKKLLKGNMQLLIETLKLLLGNMKNYAYADKSMMELYSVMFNTFFRYNSKLHKSVIIILENYLKRYNLIPTVKCAYSADIRM